jgi:hypothetical protein
VTSAGLVIALVLAVFAGLQWHHAEKATTEAQTQRDRAENALRLATETANGLIFDLAQKLRNVSGVPASVVADILGRARKLQEQLAAGGSASADLQRSRAAALTETADSLMTIGDLKGALDAARQSQSYMEKLAQSDPGNAEWQRDRSVSYAKLADVHLKSGEKAQAREAFNAGRTIIMELLKDHPDRAEWKSDLSWFDVQLANLDKSSSATEPESLSKKSSQTKRKR